MSNIESDYKPFVVGAYAALPDGRQAQEMFYTALADTGYVTGIEIPVRAGSLDFDSPEWLAKTLAGRFPDSVITAIPDTMRNLGTDPNFGIASPDKDGRARGIAYIREVINLGDNFNETAGTQVINRLELHSAPSKIAQEEWLVKSLEELLDDAKRSGIELVLEHCDAREGNCIGCGVGPGEKQFLPFAAEVAACSAVGIPITINWGRSVVESHDPDTPAQQVAELRKHGILGGIMCSGAGAEATQYGPVWGDAHLPLQDDEPTSWMNAERAAKFIAAAEGAELYRGIKIQTPRNFDVPARIAAINRVYQAMVQ
ncbi:DUF4862 family protein [Arcanobacterium hippocoleae]